MKRWGTATLAVAFAALLAGCQTPGLMATPNLYARGYADPFAAVPPQLQNNEVNVIFGTDRNPQEVKKGAQAYGFQRSTSLAVGLAEVRLGDNVDWDTVVRESLSDRRTKIVAPNVVGTEEVVRFGRSNERMTLVDGRAVVREEVERDEASKKAELYAMLHDALQYTDRKEVFLFVHGYNVDFNSAVLTIGQLWHFLGRIGVPVAYTWPAGRGGIRGYTADRESGEFTVFHLKQFLRGLAASPDVEKIHIIAHSRGTDVALTAVRELHIELRGANRDTRTELKLGNVILAAPDLDFEVVTQRVGAEGVLAVPERMTVYISPEDKAIRLSAWLFDSLRRIGTLRSSDLSEYQREHFDEVGFLSVIDTHTKKGLDFFAHSYFYQNPAVSSDLVLILRENRSVGAANGRPLSGEGDGFWRLDDSYPEFDESQTLPPH